MLSLGSLQDNASTVRQWPASVRLLNVIHSRPLKLSYFDTAWIDTKSEESICIEVLTSKDWSVGEARHTTARASFRVILGACRRIVSFCDLGIFSRSLGTIFAVFCFDVAEAIE